MVPIIDLILILFLFGFVFYGFFFGFIRTVGSLVALVLGLWVAGNFYPYAYGLIQSWFLGYDTFGKISVYIILFTLANRLIMLGFSLLETAFNLISIIPFLKTINRFAGVALGFVEGSVVLSVILYTIISYKDVPFIGGFIMDLLAVSEIAPFFIKLASYVSPLLPVIMEKIASVV